MVYQTQPEWIEEAANCCCHLYKEKQYLAMGNWFNMLVSMEALVGIRMQSNQTNYYLCDSGMSPFLLREPWGVTVG